MAPSWIRPFFFLAAAYDLVLGVGMLIFYKRVYDWAGIAPPNHDAYVQFGAAAVAVMGYGFLLVALNPGANRGIMRVGIAFKLAYIIPVLWHYFFGSIPAIWTVFAWCDVVFATGFAWALEVTRRRAA